MAESDGEWKIRDQFEYKGLIWAHFTPESTLREIETYPLVEDDVVIATYPKMGTTLTQELVYLIINDGNTEKAMEKPIQERVPFMENEEDNALKTIKEMPAPRLMKTHLPFHMMPKDTVSKNPRVIHVSRNPKDTLVSYFHFYRANFSFNYFSQTWHDFYQLHQDGKLYCGDMTDHVIGWWNAKEKLNALFLTYEDMVRNPHANINKIADFLGKNLSYDVVDKIANHTSFSKMKNNPTVNYNNVFYIDSSISPFMRKGVIGDWKNQFSDEESKEFDDTVAEKFRNTCSIYNDC